MSTLDSLDSSLESSRPVKLYRFALGSEELFYTDAESDITFNGNTYRAESIIHGPISKSANERGRPVEVTVPATNEFVARYNLVVPGGNATLTILRYQPDAASAQTSMIFKGFVSRVPFDKGAAKLVVKPIEAVVSRTLPRDKFIISCNNVLYDAQCGVNPDAFKVLGVCTAVSANVITVSGAESQPDGYWETGFVTPTGIGDFRMVLAHSGQNLTLLLPFPVSVVGATIEMHPGCNHQADGHCSTRFSNVTRNGGFPFSPRANPWRPSGVF